MRNEILVYSGNGSTIDLSRSPFFLDELDLGDMENSFISTKGLGQDGVTVTGFTLNEREITIGGHIRAMSRDELGIFRQKLLSAFNTKIPGVLQYSYGGITKEIDVKVSRAVKLKKTEQWNVNEYEVVLLAEKPYFRDIKESRKEIATWEGTFHFPLRITQGYIMGFKQPSLIVNIVNDGDCQIGMKIVFIAKGTVIKPYIYDVNKRKQIKLNRTMAPGERITVNTRFNEKSAISMFEGTEINVLNYLMLYDEEFEWLQLDCGDNLLRYGADSYSENLEIEIYFTNQFTGV